MKILIIGNYLADKQQSMIRFADMIGHLIGAVVWRPPVVFSCGSGHDRGGFSKLFGHMDKFALGFPALMWFKFWYGAQLTHIGDQGNAIYGNIVSSNRLVITCHDVFAIQAGLKGELKLLARLLQWANLRGLRRASRIVCVSDMTARQLPNLGIVSNRIVIIPNALNRPFRVLPGEVVRAGLERMRIPTDFIVHVGGNQWYKNRPGVVRHFNAWRMAHSDVGMSLVLIGKQPPRELQECIDNSPFKSEIIVIVDASDDDVEIAYNGASLMLFPSLSEGFGWPIAEAQACGCPVVTSNREPMTDVGGDAALYANPENESEMAAAIQSALQQRQYMRERGLMNALRFDRQVMLDAYAQVFAEIGQ